MHQYNNGEKSQGQIRVKTQSFTATRKIFCVCQRLLLMWIS